MLCPPNRHARTVYRGIGLSLAIGLSGADLAPGQLPGAGPSPRTGFTREELTRSWDLDGDGTISKSEAEVAKARMKRERMELHLGPGSDPVTGLPRVADEAPAEDYQPGDEPEFRLPPEEPLLPPSRGMGAAVPGTGSRSITPPVIRAPMPSTGRAPVPSPTVPRLDPSRPSSDVPGTGSTQGRSTGASWLSPGSRGSALTGGVRAGAPAAAAGYGSGPWSDLNAARYRYAPTPVDLPRAGAAGLGVSGVGASGRRTGSILLPNGGMIPQPGLPGPMGRPTPSLPSVSQPMAPPPPTIPAPRISADEIGGY